MELHRFFSAGSYTSGSKVAEQLMGKRIVLDTNILLHFHSAISGFEKNDVYLLGTTLEELDAKKTEFREIGYHARETIRILEELRMKGDLIKGVKLTNGGRLIIEPDGVNPDKLPAGYSIAKPDNRIISACLTLNQQKRKSLVILVTEDAFQCLGLWGAD